MIRVRRTVNSTFPGVPMNPYAMARTINGAARIPSSVTAVMTIVTIVIMEFVNSHASLRFSSEMYSVKIGMKAALAAPSPTSRLRRLGIR